MENETEDLGFVTEIVKQLNSTLKYLIDGIQKYGVKENVEQGDIDWMKEYIEHIKNDLLNLKQERFSEYTIEITDCILIARSCILWKNDTDRRSFRLVKNGDYPPEETNYFFLQAAEKGGIIEWYLSDTPADDIMKKIFEELNLGQ